MRHYHRWLIVFMVVFGALGLLLTLPDRAAARSAEVARESPLPAQAMPEWEWRWEARWEFNGSTDGRLTVVVRDRNDPAVVPLTATLRIACTSQGPGSVGTRAGQGLFPGDAYLDCTMPSIADAVEQLTMGQARPDPVEGYDRFWMRAADVGYRACITCSAAFPQSRTQLPLLAMQGFDGSMEARNGRARIITRVGVQSNRSTPFGPRPDGRVTWIADHLYDDVRNRCGVRFRASGKNRGKDGYPCPAPGEAVQLSTGVQTIQVGLVPGAPAPFQGTINTLIIDPPNWSVIGGQ